MPLELRNTGISVVGDVPWGAHYCCFYETKQDLLDIVIPYFKAGLENNEFCLWIISNSELLTVQEARDALQEILPDLDQDVGRSLEIVGHDDWFLIEGSFDFHKVARRFKEKLDEALAKGYAGMRVNGSPAWIQTRDTNELRHFEEEVNHLFPNERIIASCTYPVGRSRADFLLDVARNHQFVVARRQGNWEALETPELMQAKREIKRLNEELEERVIERTKQLAAANEELRKEIAERKRAEDALRLSEDRTRLIIDTIPVMAWSVRPDGSVDFINQRWLDYTGLTWEQYVQNPMGAVHPDDVPGAVEKWQADMPVEEPYEHEMRLRRVDGEYRWFLVRVEPLRDKQGNLVKWYGVSIDIDERRHAEALLHAREQEFRAIVENAPDQIIRYDKGFRRTYINPAVTRTYGLTAEALIGKPIGSVIHDAALDVMPEELALLRQRIATVFETGKSYEYEMTWPSPSGRRCYSVRLFPELDLNGSVINVLGISRDITERKLAGEELKKEKELLEKIFDNIPVMIGFVGDDGVKLVNPEWERTIGWTLKELQEQKVDIFVEAYPDPDYRQKVMDFVAASTGEWADLKIKVRDGRVIDAACAVVHLSDGTRVAIAQDITERKQAEQTLKRSETQLAEAQRLAHVGSWDWDLRTNALTWSDELYRIFGLQPGEIKVRGDAMSFIHPEDRDSLENTVERSIKNNEPYSLYYRIRRPDGEERILHSRGRIASSQEGQPIRVIGVTQDLTKVKRAEEELRATTEQMRALSARLQSAKEEEDIRISREIHDEMGSALTSLRWELERFDKTVSEAAEWPQLQAVRNKIADMMRLTDSTIGTMRRIASELRPSILDDLGLVEAIEWQTQQFQTRTSIVGHCDCSLEKVDFDPEQSTAIFRIFQEALTNILSHAKATRVEVVAREDNGEFVLTISDNGRGITENEKSGRLSLGILGMRERAHLIGGELEITRTEGKGTRVSVRVPFSRKANR